MRILVSNDDGINAEGLVVLERIAKTLSKDVWIAAPEVEQSGAAHSLTLHLPVRIRKITPRRYAVSGTPTDCVLLALCEIIRAKKKGGKKETAGPQLPAKAGVDLVLSGINRGSNVGDDVTYSGTVAAAMEGAILGVPSIALSQLFDDAAKVHWKTAETHAPKLIKKLLAVGWPAGTFININFPDCPPGKVKGVRVCPQGKRLVNVALTQRVDPKGRPYYWIGGERNDTADRDDVDIMLLNKGYITVTPLCLDLTDYKGMDILCAAV
jgi:5'-nucleotidase